MLPKGTDIVDLDTGYPGTKSDINLFRKNQDKFHTEQRFSGDKGYVGSTVIKTPKKKTKTKSLTPLEVDNNRELSSERIFVEHVIRLLKIFRVAQERFRLNSEQIRINSEDSLWVSEIENRGFSFVRREGCTNGQVICQIKTIFLG